MDLQNCYEYTELVQPDAFRIILLKPSTVLASLIECTLITTTLLEYDNDVVDHYTALSYVWGDEKDTRTVVVDGKPLEITATLESALRHIRDPQRVSRVWADGICINQFDNREKNVQVGLMGSIYELVRHTIIFLGEATNGSEAVMEVLCSNAKTSFDQRGGSELWLNVTQRLTTLDSVPDRKKSKGMLTVSLASQVQNSQQANIRELANKHILQRPWFTRVWVLQELVLSADPWVQVGTSRIRWNMFCDHLLYPPSSDELSGGLQLLSDMQNARTKIAPSWLPGKDAMPLSQRDLLPILHSRRGFGVKDPRDMIYAHLGIVDTNSELERPGDFIQIDYTKTIREVYMDAALYLIPLRGTFDFLSHVEDVPLGQRRDDLPSWVPDWTSPHTFSEVTRHIGETSHLQNTKPVHIAIKSRGVLGCIGYNVGVIEEILDGIPPRVDLMALWEELYMALYEEKIAKTPGHILSPNSDHTRQLDKSDIFQAMLFWAILVDEIVQSLHTQLSLWLGEQHCRRIESHYEDAGVLIYQRVMTYLKCQPGSMPSVNQFGDLAPTNTTSIMPYLLLGMTDIDGPGCFSGRLKVARLPNQRLAMVPGTVQVGDIICTFNLAATTYVLRKTPVTDTELDTTIVKFFIDNKLKAGENDIRDEATGLLEHLDTSKVEHYNFISECFADLPNNRNGFWERSIFALH